MHSRLKSLSPLSTTLLLCLVGFLQLSETPLAISSAPAQTAQEQKTEADKLFQKGAQQFRSGQFREALQTYQQVLEIRRATGDKAAIGKTLDSIGEVYISLSQYSAALDVLQQALEMRKSAGDRAGEGETLHNTGVVYLNLGQYNQALELLNRALAIHREVGDRGGEGTALGSIGAVYHRQNEFSRSLEFYRQALAIHKEVGDLAGTGSDLTGMGAVYQQQGELARALDFYQQALATHRQIGDRAGEGVALANLGAVYQQLGESAKALESYQQALAIITETGDRAGEAITLGNIGLLLNKQKQPVLAISFYKRAVNVIEALRQQLRAQPKEQLQSFTENFASIYRALADLLLQEQRVSEAQQVLDLLKVEEIGAYLQTVAGLEKPAQEIENLPQEERILESYAGIQTWAIQLGKELARLREIPPGERTPAQLQRIEQLERDSQLSRQQFNEFIRSPDVVALVQQLQSKSGGQNLSLRQLNSLRDNLRRLQQARTAGTAVLLYPLILEDRLELVLVSADAPPIHRPVPVRRKQLQQAIVEFRAALTNPGTNAKKPARQLYEWLIKPVENDLAQAEAQTIIYAPDGQLRYIPLSALYDGSRWLAQRFRINNITAASLTDLSTQPQYREGGGAPLRLLAAAWTTGTYRFVVGKREFEFSGLPSAGREVENLAAAIPGTKKLLDLAFNRKALVAGFNDYNIVHLATHAAFLQGSPDDSFILLGDGDRVTLRDIATWSLPAVDLVVLSACQTGVGGRLGNGEEILGFGYQMQETGARAAISSLWSVDDGGTQVLMNAFYAALQNGNVAKAEALRQAQIGLITGDRTVPHPGVAAVDRTRSSLPPSVERNLSHPYYWAPFVLIGNGL
ncbi:MAG: CHAT domain-containing protein [Oscillatoria princeps RMCB-10]|jgi:CHAT domain-containing protein/Tfp pilus assembly protein PilF|nr:CHAT domain-containing protein [Oscillatoria princeps RMCB-10]